MESDSQPESEKRESMEEKADEQQKKDDNNDDAMLLSQASDEEGWFMPSQPDKISLLSETLREDLLKQFDEVPFGGNVHMLTNEINRLRNVLAETLGEKQLLEYKIKNLNRENAMQQDYAIRMQQAYDWEISELKRKFEKVEKEMRNVILCQEQDLRSREFRDRLHHLSLAATENAQAEGLDGVENRKNSPTIRLKKVVIVKTPRSGRPFPQALDGTRTLRKAFFSCKKAFSTLAAAENRKKSAKAKTTEQKNDGNNGDNSTKKVPADHGIQTFEGSLFSSVKHLATKRVLKLKVKRGKLIACGFRNLKTVKDKRRGRTRKARMRHRLVRRRRKR